MLFIDVNNLFRAVDNNAAYNTMI